MTRFTRTFVLPLLFASFGVSAVVAFGEPVQPAAPVACAAGSLTDLELAEAAAIAEAVEVAEVAEIEETDHVRSVNAARMRWSITLPSPRRSSCCRL